MLKDKDINQLFLLVYVHIIGTFIKSMLYTLIPNSMEY